MQRSDLLITSNAAIFLCSAIHIQYTLTPMQFRVQYQTKDRITNLLIVGKPDLLPEPQLESWWTQWNIKQQKTQIYSSGVGVNIGLNIIQAERNTTITPGCVNKQLLAKKLVISKKLVKCQCCVLFLPPSGQKKTTSYCRFKLSKHYPLLFATLLSNGLIMWLQDGFVKKQVCLWLSNQVS